MIIDEKHIREIIRNSLIKEIGFSSIKSSASSSSSSSDFQKETGATYSGPLLTVVGNKKYIGNSQIGLSPPGFWESFRKNLQLHIDKEYPDIGIKIDNLGVTRELSASVDTSNKDRVSGSKHGAGLAQDVYLHTAKQKFTNYKSDNQRLAKDKKLVNAIISFMELPDNNKILWGGTFGGGGKIKDSMPVGHGITEFHHFEFKNEFLSEFFKPFEEELKKIGINDVNTIKSISALADIYNKLLNQPVNTTDPKEEKKASTDPKT